MATISSSDADTQGGCSKSMSRAARRREKKRRKQQQQQNKAELEDDDVAVSKELPLPEIHERPPPANKKPKLDNNDDNDGEKEEAQTVDEVIHKLVSGLTPAKILLLQELDKDERHTSDGVDVAEVLQNEITSKQRARALFQSLLESSVSLDRFYDTYWEKQPLLVKTKNPERLDGFLSLDGIRTLIETEPLYYGKDLNVTRYDDTIGDGIKRRITLDPVPTSDQPDDSEQHVLVDPKDVWSNYEDSGCSVRLLCPHKHNDALHALLSTLELEWGCMVGANVYLTPPKRAQGFAPHYDDIEAFVLQLEGYKHWKVYAPLSKAETLPRTSSPDYAEKDLEGVEPVMDVVLGPGDMLYMPRGWIHQAVTLQERHKKNEHSLHLTVSVMQQWAWADFLELLLPEALEATAASDRSTSLREGLPLRFLNYMGAIHDNSNDEELPEGLKQMAEDEGDDNDRQEGRDGEKERMRELFRDEAKKRIMRVTREALNMLDAACDQIGKRFTSDRQPPAFTPAEAKYTSECREENGGKVWPNTLVRLARPGIARLALEDGKAVLYHCVDNSRVYQGNPLSPLEYEMDDAPALEMILTTVEPHWIQVQDLIHGDIEDKMELAQSLYDEGILAILQAEKPDKSFQVK